MVCTKRLLRNREVQGGERLKETDRSSRGSMAGQKRGLFPREERKEKKRDFAALFFCGRSEKGR